MNGRTISILILLALITFGGIWFFSRRPVVPAGEPSIESLIIGTNIDYPPFSFIENDQIVGFDIDVARELAKRVNKKFTFTSMSFEALIPELQMGNIHLIAAGMTPTPEREKRALFTTPHLEADPLMAVQKKGTEPITNKEQLKHKTVVVNQGYSSDYYVSDIGDIDMVRISSPLISTGLLTLDGDQADVYVASKSSLQPFLAKKNKNYTITPIKDTGESYALAVSKKYPLLYSSLQSTMNEMLKDGTIATLKQKWNLND
jgi:arginine/lysine/histidine transporter system substrate-binding protein